MTPRLLGSLLVLPAVFGAQVAAAAPDACSPGYWCEGTTPGEPYVERGHIDLPPPPPALIPRRKHALSLRVTQMFRTDPEYFEAAALTGLGLTFRVRPIRWIGIEPGLDLLTGYDQHDSSIGETDVSTDFLFYLNPRDAVQAFALAGASVAWAKNSELWAQSKSTEIGMQFGAGLEFRVTHLISFNVNAVGFTRRLVGAELRPSPHESALDLPQTSGGVLLRGSIAAYF
jgi:hypothetical protein